MRRARSLVIALAVLAACQPAEARRPRSRKSPHVQIDAIATVLTEPKRVTHENRREFLEFTIRLDSASKRPSARAGDAADLALDTTGEVKVVHDLSCGGAAVELSKGDRIEIGGEYVKVPRGGDLIHFTHPADGSCGTAGGHPDGYLRRKS
jgi:hypothetical protein